MIKTKLRAVIYTGGEAELARIPQEDLRGDFVIAADCGMKKAIAENARPDLLVGDFDSMEIPDEFRSLPVYRMPAEKNETDTMTAVRKALEAGATELFMVGGTGGRADHTLSNLFLLEDLATRGITAELCDGYNRIRVLRDGTVHLPRRGYRYFSLLALEDSLVTIRGAKYPLTDAPLTRRDPYAVSNEILGAEAVITLNGTCVLTESGDRTEFSAAHILY